MALDESVLSDLLAAVKAGDGVELVRELAQWGLQQPIIAEASFVALRISAGCDRGE